MKNFKIDDLRFIFSNISKLNFTKLLFYIFAISLLETLGVALIVPVFKFIFSSRLYEFSLVNKFQLRINTIRIVVISFFVLFFIIKNTISFSILNKQLYYIFSLQETLSNKLFVNYIHRDFSIHIKSDSSILTRNILNETNTLSNTLIQILYFISEFLTLSFILLLLFIYQPVYTTIIIISVLTSVLLFYKYFSKKTKSIGEERQKQDARKIKNIQIGLNSLKEIKIFSSEDFFIEKFSETNRKSMLNAKIQNLYQQIPKLYLEVIIIITFSLLSIIFIIQEKTISEVVLILSFFGAAIFRLLPSLNRLMVAVQSIQLGYPSFQLLSEELKNSDNLQKNIDQIKINNFVFKKEIEITNLNFYYDTNKKPILNNLSLKIQKGSFIAIIGESGRGKSTFVNIFAGLIKPQNINSKLDGIEFNMYNNCQWKNKIGYVPQKINIIDGTISENIAFGIKSEFINEEKINQSIILSGLSTYIVGLSDGSNHLIGDYGGLASGGQLQRLAIARALYHEPEILILDEATSSLDSKIEAEILSNLKSLNKKITIIMITHKKDNLDFCDDIYLLNDLKLTKI